MKWLTKDQFQASRPPLSSRSAGKSPSLLAFGLFGLFYAFTFFQLFLQQPKALQLLAKCRLLVSFWTLWNFSKLFQLFGLLQACTSSYKPKKFAAGLPMGMLTSPGNDAYGALAMNTMQLLDQHPALRPTQEKHGSRKNLIWVWAIWLLVLGSKVGIILASDWYSTVTCWWWCCANQCDPAYVALTGSPQAMPRRITLAWSKGNSMCASRKCYSSC